jgi:hypothetical protein
MSEFVDIENIKSRIDDIANNGIAYVIGLYVFLDSSVRYQQENVIDTLEPAFGRDVAENVYKHINEAFRYIDKAAKVKIRECEEWLSDYLKKYILEKHLSKILIEEVEKRFSQMPERDKKILSVACVLVNKLKDKEFYPEILTVRRSEEGLLTIYSSDYEFFTKTVSVALDFEIHNVRALFYKYLLGFQSDSMANIPYFYAIKIYPFTESYIEKLASEVSNYVKIPDKSEIKSKLYELYKKGDLLKLNVIDWALSYDRTIGSIDYIARFFGIPHEDEFKRIQELTKRVVVEGIIKEIYVNPLVHDYVLEVMDTLYKEALKELMDLFKGIFKREGYEAICAGNDCIFAKKMARAVRVTFIPWISENEIAYYSYYLRDIPDKVIIMLGIPSELFLQSIENEGPEGLWLFLDKENRKLYVAKNTYISEKHQELIKILSKDFTIEFIGPAPKDS